MLIASTMILLNLSNRRYIHILKGPFIWALLFLGYPNFSMAQTPSIEKLSRDPQWLKLYRYHSVGSSNDSTVTNESWFFHSDGRQDPLKELEEAIKVLSHSQDKRCLFPARTLFLKRKGLLKEGSDTCPKYEYFARKLELENIWIVFASYYVNNPSSAFGHTLFKIEGKGNQQNDYLEYGANFAAENTTPNPILYAFLGLTGGFKGNYGLLPYFVKIQEYNDSETRDLWEYKLNFNDEEKELFLAHLWEMDQAQFDYYYLTENCSYHLLAFLEAIRPELKFTQKMPYFVLPSETLSILNKEKGFVTQIKKRPSQFNIVKRRFENLSPAAQDYWTRTKDYHPAPSLSSTEKANYLDYTIDYIDLKFQKDLYKEAQAGSKNAKITQIKREVQLERSRYNEPSIKITPRLKQSPERIHPPRTLSLGYQWRQYSKQGLQAKTLHKNTLFGYRFSFHEMLDNPEGAPTWSELIMGKVLARYDEEDKKVYLDQFTLFRTHANQQTLMAPHDLSWLVEMGARDHLFSEHHDFGPYVKTHIGYNWQNSKELFRIVLPFELDYSSRNSYIKSNWKLLASPRLSYYRYLTKKLRGHIDVGAMWRSYQKNKTSGFLESAFQYDLNSYFSLEANSFLQKKLHRSTFLMKYYF